MMLVSSAPPRGPGVGDVGVGQRREDAVLPHHGLVTALGNLAGRPAQSPAVLAPAHLEDLVGGAAGDESAGDGLTLAGEALGVHPLPQRHGLDQALGALGLGGLVGVGARENAGIRG